MPRPLNSLGHHALMARAGPGYSPRNNLPTLGNELGAESPEDHLLVIYESRFVYTEHTDFATWFTKLTWLAARFAG